jgi:transposase
MKRCPKLTSVQQEELSIALKHPSDEKELKRIQAIFLVDQEQSKNQISLLTGFGKTRAFVLRRLYQSQGISVIKSKPKNPKRLLTKAQRGAIEALLQDKQSTQRLYGVSFWTTGMLAKYILNTYGVQYKSRTSYYVLFKEGRFSYHKPGMVSVKRDEGKVAVWRQETKKKLQAAWEDPTTIILCEDEVVLSTQTTVQKVWLPTNEYPKVESTTQRKNKSVYGFLNMKTGRQHAISFERQNMFNTTKALQHIRRIYPKNDNKRNKVKGVKILLLWDNPGWHKGSKVTEYVEKDGDIEIIYFPAYAPEENPQEHVWKKAKETVVGNRFIENINTATKNFLTYLTTTNFPYKLLGFGSL